MSSTKKFDLYRDFAAGFYLYAVQNPTPPPPVTHCIRVYSILIHTGKRGRGELNQKKRLEGHNSQSWVENTNMTDCISSL